jgi:hypothetical protein
VRIVTRSKGTPSRVLRLCEFHNSGHAFLLSRCRRRLRNCELLNRGEPIRLVHIAGLRKIEEGSEVWS